MRRIALLSMCVVSAPPAMGAIITVRSGNGSIGQPDGEITFVAGGSLFPLSNSAFTSADFADARNGPNALVVGQRNPAWAQLNADPQAEWIGADPAALPASALYAMDFQVGVQNITNATVDFHWNVDDKLGDVDGNGDPTGPNPIGVYINGTPLDMSFSGGGLSSQSSASADVTSLLNTGQNQLYVYNRDTAAIISGVIFSATFNVIPAPPTGALALSGIALAARRRR